MEIYLPRHAARTVLLVNARLKQRADLAVFVSLAGEKGSEGQRDLAEDQRELLEVIRQFLVVARRPSIDTRCPRMRPA